MHNSNNRFPFTAYPKGIFAIDFSNKLKKGMVKSHLFMGHKIALFRTRDGSIGAIDGYCPHLGADLTFGKVINNKIQCPFHGLCFDTNGETNAIKSKCEKVTPYKTKSYPVFEKYNMIFIAYHTNNISLPNWELSSWGKPSQNSFRIKSHPQEILENSVDQAHFRLVHQYQNPSCTSSFSATGTEFTVSYCFERKLSRYLSKTIKIKINIHAYGLGVSIVDIALPQFGITAKQIVMPTPGDGEFINVSTLTSFKTPLKPNWLPRFIKSTFATTMSQLLGIGFQKDFKPDITIWENKKYISNPRYLKQDGDFTGFRTWASQFYWHSSLHKPKDNPIVKHKDTV